MKKKKMNIDKINLVFVLPAMLIVFLLLVYPIFSSIYFSFTSKNLIRPYYKWIWFDNFKFVLTNPEFYHAFPSKFNPFQIEQSLPKSGAILSFLLLFLMVKLP